MKRDDSNNLYNIPIQHLGLSAKAIMRLYKVGITSVGDCLDFFERAGSNASSFPIGFLDTMYTEILQQLKTHNYLTNDGNDENIL